MKKIIELKLGASLLTITFSMLGGIDHAVAQTCTTPPSCAVLGYKQSASDCAEQQMLKCPFDNSKVFCGGTDCDGYTLSSCDTTKGTCSSCNGKYKYTSCKSGYTLSGATCIQLNDSNCNGWQSENFRMVTFKTCTGDKTGKTYYSAITCTTDKKVCRCDEAPFLYKNACICSDMCNPF